MQLNVMARTVINVTAHVTRMPADDFLLMDANESVVENRAVPEMNPAPDAVGTTVARGAASPNIANPKRLSSLDRYRP